MLLRPLPANQLPFRIHRLGIEGFKAFAAPQLFEIGGHVFVFGRNGLGKSSVVEAVRWCLFGLADRPEAEVRNVFYSAGECKVELELEGPGGRWRLQRRLRPGSGRSDLTIQDPSGAAVQQSKVFPHIARLGPREGTHIIFASQQSTHRRPQADITDFDKVLYSYLQIDDVPDLLDRLDRELEDRGGTQMNEREQDSGKTYADIWSEAVHINRHLRVLSMGFAGLVLLLVVIIIRLSSVELPKPIVVRVDEVGRAEALSYETVEAQADPLDPTTKYFLNRFIDDYYSPARGDGRAGVARARSAF